MVKAGTGDEIGFLCLERTRFVDFYWEIGMAMIEVEHLQKKRFCGGTGVEGGFAFPFI